MKSKIIIHNQVSLNGAFLGFEVDMEKYYSIINSYHPKYILIGSNTAKSGIDMYYEETPVESPDDFRQFRQNDGITAYIQECRILQGYHSVHFPEHS